jgi:hypothetical protein
VAALSQQFADADWLICGSSGFQGAFRALLDALGISSHRIHVESFTRGKSAAGLTTRARCRRSGSERSSAISRWRRLRPSWPRHFWCRRCRLLHRLQTSIVYSALTGVAVILLALLQWRLSYVRALGSRQDTSRAYGLHIAIGPIVLGAILLHSTHFGYALSMACAGQLPLQPGVRRHLGAHPRSEKWQWPRRLVVGSHILLTCAGLRPCAGARLHGALVLTCKKIRPAQGANVGSGAPPMRSAFSSFWRGWRS